MTPRLADRIALGVAIIALALLGLRPATTRMTDAGVAVVRTPGASLADARAVADSLGGARVIDLVAGERPGQEARLHLVGWGLDAGELRRWGDRSLVLHPRALPDGPRAATWPGSVALGAAVDVRAEVAGRRGMWAILEGADGMADSVRLEADGRNVVTLRHLPRAVGPALYRLRFGATADQFSVLVTAPAPPATLILASAPAREWSDLRDWLTRQGARVTVRTTMARERTRLERINTPPADPLTRRSLEGLGVVITDRRTLASLPRPEVEAIRAAVREGLGLVVVLDQEERRETEPLVPWGLAPVADLPERQVRPRSGDRSLSPTPVAAEGAVIGSGPFGARRLLDDGQGGVLAMAVPMGRGRVAGTVVNGAGRWLRGGEDLPFARYWHTLVDAVARSSAATEGWDLPGSPVVVDARYEVARAGAPAAVWAEGGDTLAPSADPLAPGWQRAVWWPTRSGWNEVAGTRVVAAGAEGWRTWSAAERTRLTEAAIVRHRGEAATGAQVPVRVRWPLLPFFLAFVGAAAVLWRRAR